MLYSELKDYIITHVDCSKITRLRVKGKYTAYMVVWIGKDGSKNKHIVNLDNYFNDMFDLKFNQLYNTQTEYINH